jgi:hypothetical protein
MSNSGQGINSDHVQKQLVQDAAKLHPWPTEVGLGPDISALTIYQKAQLNRSHRKWTPIDLIELARVSKLIVLADTEFETYLNEGCVVLGGRNGMTPMENPRARAISSLNAMINQSLRRLGIAAMSVNQKQLGADEAEKERAIREAQQGPTAYVGGKVVNLNDESLIS